MNLKTSKGFTIVELLIVIVVIAILAAISIVAYTGIQDRARNSSAQQLATQVAGKARAYHAVTGSWPTGITSGEFTPAPSEPAPEAALEGANVTAVTADPGTGGGDTFRNGTSVAIQFGATGADAPTIYHREGGGSTNISL